MGEDEDEDADAAALAELEAQEEAAAAGEDEDGEAAALFTHLMYAQEDETPSDELDMETVMACVASRRPSLSV